MSSSAFIRSSSPRHWIIITAIHQKIPLNLILLLIITVWGHSEFQLRIKNYTTWVETHCKSFKSLIALLFSCFLPSGQNTNTLFKQTHYSFWKSRSYFFYATDKPTCWEVLSLQEHDECKQDEIQRDPSEKRFCVQTVSVADVSDIFTTTGGVSRTKQTETS